MKLIIPKPIIQDLRF